MSLISFSNIQDGSTIDAADVNGPLNTLFNDYNGNIDSNNLKAAAVIASKLSLASSVLTKANTSSAGGTMYYINLGGIKLLWAVTDDITSGASTTAVVTFPSGFFTTVQSVLLGNAHVATSTGQTLAMGSYTTSNATIYFLGSSGTQRASLFVIGT